MRYTKIICFLFAAAFAVSAFSKQPKDKNKYGVYLAGVSASFADSLVFLPTSSLSTALRLMRKTCW